MNSKDLVLIFTNSNEVSIGHVIPWLDEFGQKSVRVNIDKFIQEGKCLALSLSYIKLSGFIEGETEIVDLKRVKSVWYRKPSYPKLLAKNTDDTEFPQKKFIEDESRTALWSLYTIIDAFWMNHPLIGFHLLECNKLYQLSIASECGLIIPETIITNNADSLIDFCGKQGGYVAVKCLYPITFQRNIDADKNMGIYTNKIGMEQLIKYRDDIKLTPVMAQEYIPKYLELRITIVGNKIFTCAIHSQDSERTKDDWRRYDFENVRHEVYKLPNETEEKLLRLMRKWQLSFGAIDMILTPDNQYVFLEINPSGQYAWIEGMTGMPISKAIAETLANPPE